MVSRSAPDPSRIARPPVRRIPLGNRGQDQRVFEFGQLFGDISPVDPFVGEREFRTTQNDWGALANLYREATNKFPNFLENWMKLVGNRIVHGVLLALEASGQNWTHTYSDSFSYKVEIDNNGTPQLHIGHLDPVGENVDRLPIYWKAMETGARPNPNLSGLSSKRAGSLHKWSMSKGGSNKLGLAVALYNRQGTRGISARPILSKYFVLAGQNLTSVGLTPKGTEIVMKAREEAWNFYLKSVESDFDKPTFSRRETFHRGGRDVTVTRDILTGRFARGGSE